MRRSLLPLLLAATTPHVWAVEPTLTQAGYSGLSITPNANLLGWGRMEASYDNQLPGIVRDTSGHNYVLGFGLLPNLEIAGRLATNSMNGSCLAAPGCGARDLSASFKAGIGLDAGNRFHIAAGAADIGGSVTYFRTYYGVLSYNEGPFELSGGWAKRGAGNRSSNSKSPLDGPFAGAAWQPAPWIRAQAEYSDGNSWAGVRLFAPNQWLPEGWAAYIGANQRLNSNNLTEKSWLSAGLSIPLYKVPQLPGSSARAPAPELTGSQQPLPAYEARNLPLPIEKSAPAVPQTYAPAAPLVAMPPPASLDQSQLRELAVALQAKGLEDISVGRMPDGSVAVRVNNQAYNWNTLDAVGAALGSISRTLGTLKVGYRLVLTQRQIPIVAVTGQTDCLRQWLVNDSPACAGGQLSTPGKAPLEPLLDGVDWLVQGQQPSWQTLRVQLAPVLRTAVGTEVGAFDSSLGVNVGLVLPLWAGATAEWRQNVPLFDSNDYQPRGVFYPQRVRTGTERLAFTQTVRVPLERWLAPGDDVAALRWGLGGVTAQGTAGRFGRDFDGALVALRWEPGEGKHRLSGQTGYFRNQAPGASGNGWARTATPLLASYRYSVLPTRTDVEATAGRFMYDDKGFRIGMRQWFSDVSVSAYYKRSQFDTGPARQFVGLELSLPIGPRRDMDPAWHVQVTGTPRFTQRLETVVREEGANFLRPGFGTEPPTASLDATFNSDRAGLAYFEDNIRRIRDAARW